MATGIAVPSDRPRRQGLGYRFDTDATGQSAAHVHPDPTWWVMVSS
jgi:hypothetical protein